jgi:DNA-binding response OmpR family regulator
MLKSSTPSGMSGEPFELMDREFINVLLVSALVEDHLSLSDLIRHSNWGLHHALGCEEAMALLQERLIPVVICDCELSDGTWRDLWRELSGLSAPPRLIVSSRMANERLWGEVLNLGVYDLLTKPFEASELFRVGFLAWHSWRNEHERKCKPPAVAEAPNAAPQRSLSATSW